MNLQTDKSAVRGALTFNTLPTVADIVKRAETLAQIADQSGASIAMIGGAPYLMSALEKALTEYGIMPVYSFSVRQSVETMKDDGTVVKTNVFHHAGWVDAV